MSWTLRKINTKSNYRADNVSVPEEMLSDVFEDSDQSAANVEVSLHVFSILYNHLNTCF